MLSSLKGENVNIEHLTEIYSPSFLLFASLQSYTYFSLASNLQTAHFPRVHRTALPFISANYLLLLVDGQKRKCSLFPCKDVMNHRSRPWVHVAVVHGPREREMLPPQKRNEGGPIHSEILCVCISMTIPALPRKRGIIYGGVAADWDAMEAP